MPRAFIILLDSFGIGASDDAAKYGDAEADTLRHIAEWCLKGKADKAGVRSGSLRLPNLTRLGLNAAATISRGIPVPGLATDVPIQGAYGCAVEKSFGKDTPSGHWEIAGVPALFDWGYFPPEYPSFPDELLDAFITRGQLPGILGNKHASGTEIIQELGEEHEKTGKPIVYTSADSVFQIAAHEESFGLQRLYDLCLLARELIEVTVEVVALPLVLMRRNKLLNVPAVLYVICLTESASVADIVPSPASGATCVDEAVIVLPLASQPTRETVFVVAAKRTCIGVYVKVVPPAPVVIE